MAKLGERKVSDEQILKIFEDREIITANEVKEFLKVNHKTALSKLKEMAEEGLIEQRLFRKSGRAAFMRKE